MGVGQSEIDIVKMADTTLVVMVPGLGDDIQAIKAGILEIGDLFIVNKADRDGANRVVYELKMMLELKSEKSAWEPPVLMAISDQNIGIKEIADKIKEHFNYLVESNYLEIKRRDRLEKEILSIVSIKIYQQIVRKIKREGKLKEYLDALMKKS